MVCVLGAQIILRNLGADNVERRREACFLQLAYLSKGRGPQLGHLFGNELKRVQSPPDDEIFLCFL